VARTARKRTVGYQTIDLDGVRYAVLRESTLHDLCRQAGTRMEKPAGSGGTPAALKGLDLDEERLAQRLIQRRRRTGLTQAELARRAGVRVETLNRIERGRTTPDFATIRKLVIAMNEAEATLPVG
jgi:DNA-binding XRE family transcriptional regulator